MPVRLPSKKKEMILPSDPEDVKLCNCARCKKELLSARYEGLTDRLPAPYHEYPLLLLRFEGRPYCEDCVKADTYQLGMLGRSLGIRGLPAFKAYRDSPRPNNPRRHRVFHPFSGN